MTRVVPAGRRALFDFLIDFRNERFFGPTIRSCRVEKEAPGGGVAEGAEFRFEYRFLGVVLATTFRVEDVVVGERFLIRSLRGGIPFTMGYAFEDAGEDCRLTVTTTLVDRRRLRWVRLPVTAAARRGMESYMDLLVAYAERTTI